MRFWFKKAENTVVSQTSTKAALRIFDYGGPISLVNVILPHFL